MNLPRILLAAGLVAGCGDAIDAPMPVARSSAPADTALALFPSVLDLPVAYDLGPAMAWLEAVVPRRIGDLGHRVQVPGNSRLEFAFSATRSPFRLRLDGTTATLSAEISYQGRGWYNPPVLPTISGSCGIDQPMPRVLLSVRTTVTPTSDWRLRGRTRVHELRPLTAESRDRCTVTVAEINVTDRVLSAVRGALDRQLGVIDRQLAAFPLRPMVEEVWQFLATPMRLQDSLWLVVDPAAIRFDRVRSEGRTLHSALGITAYPRVVSGDAPAVPPRPIPALQRVGSPPGLSLLSEATIGWDVLTGILRDELVGDTLRVAGRNLQIVDIVVAGLDDGRVAVGLDLRGAARGRVFVVGTPAFDPVDAVLSMPDLAFDVSSRSLMVRGLAWLAGGQAEEHLRQHLRISLAGVLDDGREEIERQLSRELAPGVAIATEVERGQVVRVRARPHALIAEAVVHGSAALRLDLAPGRTVGRGSR